MSEEIGRAEMHMEMQALTQAKAGGRLSGLGLLGAGPHRLIPERTPKEEVFRQLLARLPLPNPPQAMQAVWDRERTGRPVSGSGWPSPCPLPG